MQLWLFTDASFANADGNRSQLGFAIVVIDAQERANLVHYGSSRSKRVVRSIMAAELHALIYVFYQAYVVKSMLDELWNTDVQIDACVDSRTVFNTVTRFGATLEKRLQIDVFGLRESHKRGELRTLTWIPSDQNIADALTKSRPTLDHALYQILRTNKLHVNPNGWVEHVKPCQSNHSSLSSTKCIEADNASAERKSASVE
jgi:hypothetical protein